MNEIKPISIKLTKEQWMRIGGWVAEDVRDDFKDGKFQNDTKNHSYRSEQYKDYKSRAFGKKTGCGRLKQYYSKAIDSTNTAYVDMTATGDLNKSLRPIKATETSVTMEFKSDDPRTADKIRGGQALGRDVMGLSRENQRKVAGYIKKEMDEKIRKSTTNIKVNIKFDL